MAEADLLADLAGSPARRRLADAALAGAHRLVAMRLAGGTADPGFTPAQIERALLDDDRGRVVMDEAVAAVSTPDRAWPTSTPGVMRAAGGLRCHEVREALGVLALAGLVACDGPGRYALPGWGPSTLRAVLVLARAAGTPGHRWETAVARLPLADLGEVRPAWARHLPATPDLDALAMRLLTLEAERQVVRHALLVGTQRLAVLLDRRGDAGDGVALLAADCEILSRRIDDLDRRAARLWDLGAMRAAA